MDALRLTVKQQAEHLLRYMRKSIVIFRPASEVTDYMVERGWIEPLENGKEFGLTPAGREALAAAEREAPDAEAH
jgi:predicted transcriptional regulator